jgi:hypothetical protein
MRPLIDGEPWLRALQAWARDLDTDARASAPEEVLKRFLAGELAIAVTPVHASWMPEAATPGFEFVIAPVPGSDQVFDTGTSAWRPRGEQETRLVPLIGASATIASATATTENKRSAADFLAWLQDKQISSIVSVESPRAGPTWKAHLAESGRWLGEAFGPDQANAWAEYVREANDARLALTALRIPHADQYLNLLDDSVRNVVAGQANAVESLAETARQWSELNQQFGIDSQRDAYRASEGMQTRNEPN